MPKYKVTHRTNGTATIEAHRYESHGSGTFFYSEDGSLLTSFRDGEIIGVVPDDIVFTKEADVPPAIAEEGQE